MQLKSRIRSKLIPKQKEKKSHEVISCYQMRAVGTRLQSIEMAQAEQ